MELVNLDTGQVLTLRPGVVTVLGRGPESGLSSVAVSRKHCTVHYAPPRPPVGNQSGLHGVTAVPPTASHHDADIGTEPAVQLTVQHASGAAVIRGQRSLANSGGPSLLLLPAGSACQLFPGDRVFLERKDGRLVSGLELRATPSTAPSTAGGDAVTAPPPLEPFTPAPPVVAGGGKEAPPSAPYVIAAAAPPSPTGPWVGVKQMEAEAAAVVPQEDLVGGGGAEVPDLAALRGSSMRPCGVTGAVREPRPAEPPDGGGIEELARRQDLLGGSGEPLPGAVPAAEAQYGHGAGGGANGSQDAGGSGHGGDGPGGGGGPAAKRLRLSPREAAAAAEGAVATPPSAAAPPSLPLRSPPEPSRERDAPGKAATLAAPAAAPLQEAPPSRIEASPPGVHDDGMLYASLPPSLPSSLPSSSPPLQPPTLPPVPRAATGTDVCNDLTSKLNGTAAAAAAAAPAVARQQQEAVGPGTDAGAIGLDHLNINGEAVAVAKAEAATEATAAAERQGVSPPAPQTAGKGPALKTADAHTPTFGVTLADGTLLRATPAAVEGGSPPVAMATTPGAPVAATPKASGPPLPRRQVLPTQPLEEEELLPPAPVTAFAPPLQLPQPPRGPAPEPPAEPPPEPPPAPPTPSGPSASVAAPTAASAPPRPIAHAPAPGPGPMALHPPLPAIDDVAATAAADAVPQAAPSAATPLPATQPPSRSRSPPLAARGAVPTPSEPGALPAPLTHGSPTHGSGGGAGAPHPRTPTRGSPSTGAGAGAGAARGAAPGGAVPRGLFAGCRFVFWARSEVRDILARVKQAGGQEQYTVTPATTHVVAREDITAEAAQRLLRAASELAPAGTAGAGEAAVAAGGAGAAAAAAAARSGDAGGAVLPSGALFVTPAFLRDCLREGRLLDPSPYLIALARTPQPPISPPQPLPPPLRSPETPSVVSTASRLPTAGARQRPAPQQSAAPSSAAVAAVGVDAGAGATRPVAAAAPAADGAAAVTSGARHSPQAPPPGAADAEHAGSKRPPPQPHPGPRRVEPAAAGAGTSGVAAEATAASPGAQSARRIPPSPNEICARPEDWGKDERWIEPWDEQAARRTNLLLLSHWNKHSYPGDGDGNEEEHDQEEEEGADGGRGHGSGGGADAGGSGGGGGRRINTVCSHACCAARPFCIIAELKRTRNLYLGREDQFRIKALDRTLGLLARLTRPLEGPDQLRQLKLGKGSEEKVAEILATGRFGRNDTLSADEQRQTLLLFMQVWGCAEGTARKWWAGGCRSLEDVRRRSDLTAQQRLGLRHFEDFKRRLSRDEVTEVAVAVRRATLDALEALTGLPEPRLTDQLHVRPMGSYSRGSTSSSDVDFIIAPGPEADPRVAPLQLLTCIVERLLAAGLVDADSARMLETRHEFRSNKLPPIRLVPPDGGGDGAGAAAGGGGPATAAAAAASAAGAGGGAAAGGTHGSHGVHAAGAGGCTWLGVWRQPGSGRFCRVDIKVYRRRHLPFAVNYFSSGTDFNRALRYWCNAPVPAVRSLAASRHQEGSAFRLSDKELAVATRRQAPPGSRQAAQDVVLALVPCCCETDIFRAVGLDYVPPHMRDITAVE